MSAITGTLVPDILSTSQTWGITEEYDYLKLLDSIVEQLYAGDQLAYIAYDMEWSGPGVYRLQIRLNRLEGRPLYSLKWEGPL